MSAATPTFGTRDPAQAAFWDERFRAGFTPWDAGGVPAAFVRWVESGALAPGARAVIPGCGAAHEAGWLDARGYAVTAVDISAAAVERATRLLGADVATRTLRCADFLALPPSAPHSAAAARPDDAPAPSTAPHPAGDARADDPADLVYERAFLAALPPALWPRWAPACAARLAPGGRLVGFFLLDEAAADPRRGPPFAIRRAELDALLAGWRCLEDAAVPEAESLPVFAGRERWMVWARP